MAESKFNITYREASSGGGDIHGYARAKAFLMTGDLIGAPEAARMGVFNHAIPPELLDAEVERSSVCHELRHEPAMLYQRWESASRNRIAGADIKPPSAAASKRRGRERLWKRRQLDVRYVLRR